MTDLVYAQPNTYYILAVSVTPNLGLCWSMLSMAFNDGHYRVVSLNHRSCALLSELCRFRSIKAKCCNHTTRCSFVTKLFDLRTAGSIFTSSCIPLPVPLYFFFIFPYVRMYGFLIPHRQQSGS